MTLHPKPLIALLTLLTLSTRAYAADAPAATTAISLTGNIAHPQSFTPDQLKTAFAKNLTTLTYTAKDVKHTATAIPLLALITAATPDLDPKIKNHQLHFVIVVEGADGYLATFALAELQPDIANCQAFITLDMDNKPLSDRDTPAALIVPFDQKPERWVHAIKTIRIVDLSPPTTNP